MNPEFLVLIAFCGLALYAIWVGVMYLRKDDFVSLEFRGLLYVASLLCGSSGHSERQARLLRYRKPLALLTLVPGLLMLGIDLFGLGLYALNPPLISRPPAAQPPAYPLEVKSSILPAPITGQEVKWRIQITAQTQDLADVQLQVRLPAGVVFVEGNASWHGNIPAYQTETVEIVIRVAQPGEWAIDADATTTGYAATSRLYLMSTETGASVEDELTRLQRTGVPGRGTAVYRQSTLGVIITVTALPR